MTPAELCCPTKMWDMVKTNRMGEDSSQIGRVLAGRYKLQEQLSEGGMGTVYKAEHLVLAAPVAVKVIYKEMARDEDTVARFMREAQAAAALRSPHVVQILDYGVDEKTPFIVMELLDGETLAQRLRHLGKLNRVDTARIITHVARAVARAHEAGITHRDLKPENVFLVRNEDDEVAKVLDFGVAKVEAAALGPTGARTRTGSILGTPYYMSPEQAQGNKTVDFRSDLWSLGVIAFECITGKRPFYSDGLGDLVLQICVRDIPVPSEVAPSPIGFDRWFERAVQRDPDARFEGAREMAEALREALGVEGRNAANTYPEITVHSSHDLDDLAATALELDTGASTRVDEFNEPPSSHTPASVQRRGAEGRPEGVSAVSTPDAVTLAASSSASDVAGARPTGAPESLADSLEAGKGWAEIPDNAKQEVPEAAAVAAQTESPALTVRQFGTTRHTPPTPRGGNKILVLSLGSLALALGVGLVFAFSQSDDPARALPPSEGRQNVPVPAAPAYVRDAAMDAAGDGQARADVAAPLADAEQPPAVGEDAGAASDASVEAGFGQRLPQDAGPAAAGEKRDAAIASPTDIADDAVEEPGSKPADSSTAGPENPY